MAIPPLTIGAAGLAGAVGVAQGIAGARKSDFDRELEDELDDLLQRKSKGQLGLSPQQRRIREQQLLRPIQSAAEQLQSRGDRVAAATGTTSGADLSRLRTESARQIGEGTQQAATQIASEDEAATQRQLEEIESRRALVEQRRRERQQSAFSALGSIAGAAGAVAGAVPEATQATEVAGLPIKDRGKLVDNLVKRGVPQEGVDAILRMDPNKLTQIIEDLRNGSITSEDHLTMAQIIAAQQGTEQVGTNDIDQLFAGDTGGFGGAVS